MPWPTVTLINFNIHNVALQANTLLSGGGRATQEYNTNAHNGVLDTRTYTQATNSASPLLYATERRVEAQLRIRRKLEEVASSSEGNSRRLGVPASLAISILSVVEKFISCNAQLVDLAMDAHAVAYISVVLSLHGQPRISKKSTKKLTELLSTIHMFLEEAAAKGSVIVRLRRIAIRSRRKAQVMSMRQDLLKFLRQIERNDDAAILSSLNAALDYSQR